MSCRKEAMELLQQNKQQELQLQEYKQQTQDQNHTEQKFNKPLQQQFLPNCQKHICHWDDGDHLDPILYDFSVINVKYNCSTKGSLKNNDTSSSNKSNNKNNNSEHIINNNNNSNNNNDKIDNDDRTNVPTSANHLKQLPNEMIVSQKKLSYYPSPKKTELFLVSSDIPKEKINHGENHNMVASKNNNNHIILEKTTNSPALARRKGFQHQSSPEPSYCNNHTRRAGMYRSTDRTRSKISTRRDTTNHHDNSNPCRRLFECNSDELEKCNESHYTDSSNVIDSNVIDTTHNSNNRNNCNNNETYKNNESKDNLDCRDELEEVYCINNNSINNNGHMKNHENNRIKTNNRNFRNKNQCYSFNSAPSDTSENLIYPNNPNNLNYSNLPNHPICNGNSNCNRNSICIRNSKANSSNIKDHPKRFSWFFAFRGIRGGPVSSVSSYSNSSTSAITTWITSTTTRWGGQRDSGSGAGANRRLYFSQRRWWNSRWWGCFGNPSSTLGTGLFLLLQASLLLLIIVRLYWQFHYSILHDPVHASPLDSSSLLLLPSTSSSLPSPSSLSSSSSSLPASNKMSSLLSYFVLFPIQTYNAESENQLMKPGIQIQQQTITRTTQTTTITHSTQIPTTKIIYLFASDHRLPSNPAAIQSQRQQLQQHRQRQRRTPKYLSSTHQLITTKTAAAELDQNDINISDLRWSDFHNNVAKERYRQRRERTRPPNHLKMTKADTNDFILDDNYIKYQFNSSSLWKIHTFSVLSDIPVIQQSRSTTRQPQQSRLQRHHRHLQQQQNEQRILNTTTIPQTSLQQQSPYNWLKICQESGFNNNSRLLVTGIVTVPLASYVTLLLHQQCNVTTILGIDSMLPNFKTHVRLDAMNAYQQLYRVLSSPSQPHKQRNFKFIVPTIATGFFPSTGSTLNYFEDGTSQLHHSDHLRSPSHRHHHSHHRKYQHNQRHQRHLQHQKHQLPQHHRYHLHGRQYRRLHRTHQQQHFQYQSQKTQKQKKTQDRLFPDWLIQLEPTHILHFESATLARFSTLLSPTTSPTSTSSSTNRNMMTETNRIMYQVRRSITELEQLLQYYRHIHDSSTISLTDNDNVDNDVLTSKRKYKNRRHSLKNSYNDQSSHLRFMYVTTSVFDPLLREKNNLETIPTTKFSVTDCQTAFSENTNDDVETIPMNNVNTTNHHDYHGHDEMNEQYCSVIIHRQKEAVLRMIYAMNMVLLESYSSLSGSTDSSNDITNNKFTTTQSANSIRMLHLPFQTYDFKPGHYHNEPKKANSFVNYTTKDETPTMNTINNNISHKVLPVTDAVAILLRSFQLFSDDKGIDKPEAKLQHISVAMDDKKKYNGTNDHLQEIDNETLVNPQDELEIQNVPYYGPNIYERRRFPLNGSSDSISSVLSHRSAAAYLRQQRILQDIYGIQDNKFPCASACTPYLSQILLKEEEDWRKMTLKFSSATPGSSSSIMDRGDDDDTGVCVSSLWDDVYPISVEATRGCSYVLYIINLSHDVTTLFQTSTYDSNSQNKPPSGVVKLCRIAFLSGLSPLVQNAVRQHVQLQRQESTTTATNKNSTLQNIDNHNNDYVENNAEELSGQTLKSYNNGQLKHNGWTMVWITDYDHNFSRKTTKTTRSTELSLPLIDPTLFFADSVSKCMYTDISEFAEPPDSSLIRILNGINRPAVPNHMQKVFVSGLKNVYNLVERPAEPARTVIFFAAEPIQQFSHLEDYYDSLFDNSLLTDSKASENINHIDTAINGTSKNLNGDNLQDGTKQQSRHQLNFYKQAYKYWLEDDRYRPEYEIQVQKHEQNNFFLSKSLLIHDLQTEHARIFRCRWYQEHAFWGNDSPSRQQQLQPQYNSHTDRSAGNMIATEMLSLTHLLTKMNLEGTITLGNIGPSSDENRAWVPVIDPKTGQIEQNHRGSNVYFRFLTRKRQKQDNN